MIISEINPHIIEQSTLLRSINSNDYHVDINKDEHDIIFDYLNCNAHCLTRSMISTIPKIIYLQLPTDKFSIHCAIYGKTTTILKNNNIYVPNFTLENTEQNKWSLDICHYGYLDCLKYVHLHMNSTITKEACIAAAKNGNFSCLKYAYENNIFNIPDLCDHAAKHLDCLEYAFSLCYMITKTTVVNAALSKNMDCLEFIYKKHPDSIKLADNQIAKCGDLNILKFFKARGYVFNNECFNYAVFMNDVEGAIYICQFLKPSTELAIYATKNVEILKFVLKLNIVLDEKICIKAIENNNLESLKYAYENGCPLTHSSACMAFSRTNVECLKYIYDKGVVINDDFHGINRLLSKTEKYDKCLEIMNLNEWHSYDYGY